MKNRFIIISDPIIVKTRANQAKATPYGVIFTYMTTHAIHSHRTGDLTTNSFILDLRRFISHTKHIPSGNETSFKGAPKELQDAIAEINISKVVSEKVNKHFNFIWTFDPTSSPWMGGPWETLIKSVNRVLKAIACHLLFTKEALHTFI